MNADEAVAIRSAIHDVWLVIREHRNAALDMRNVSWMRGEISRLRKLGARIATSEATLAQAAKEFGLSGDEQERLQETLPKVRCAVCRSGEMLAYFFARDLSNIEARCPRHAGNGDGNVGPKVAHLRCRECHGEALTISEIENRADAASVRIACACGASFFVSVWSESGGVVIETGN